MITFLRKLLRRPANDDGPRWTEADEAELRTARRHHRPTRMLMARKSDAIHAEVARIVWGPSRWRGAR